MNQSLSLSADGQFFDYCCPHCGTTRQEHASPDRNPAPFDFMPRCSGCGHLVEIDHTRIAAIQASYSRALSLGKKIPATGSTVAGFEGGDLTNSGSPAYSAFSRADAEMVAGAGLEPATSWL
jgi:hypothetical protein